MIFPQMVTERPLPNGGTTTLGGGTTISGGGTPDTGGGTPFRPVPAEFNHWQTPYLDLRGSTSKGGEREGRGGKGPKAGEGGR